jgi:uncharacterized protein YraI
MRMVATSAGLAVLIAAAAAGAARAAEPVTAKVLSDRVNLRAKPDSQGDVVTQVDRGATLTVKSVDGDWVEVVPPDNAAFWVHRDLVSSNMVSATRLNVRAGAGINYTSVGALERGAAIVPRGVLGEWIKIAPLPAFSLWVSRPLVEVAAPPPPPMVVAVSAPPASLPAAPAVAGRSLPPPVGPGAIARPLAPPGPLATAAPPAVAASAATVPPPPADLKLIPLQGQGRLILVEGEVKPAEYLLGAPAPHRLTKHVGNTWTTICHLRGNRAQLDGFLGRSIRVKGREYWVQGSERPVVVVESIELDAP